MRSDIEEFIEGLERAALKKRGGVPFGLPLPAPEDTSEEPVEEPEEAQEELTEEGRNDPGRKLRERLRRRRVRPVPGSMDRAHEITKNRRERRLRDAD